jgi:short-chain fatty acids transporter
MSDLISRIGLRISALFRACAPEPFVLAIILTFVTALAALIWGRFPEGESGALALLDAWRMDSGLWKFLAFGMQMCLVLVTGHALASSPPVERAIARLASIPRSTSQAAAMVGLVACLTGLLNWGLCLIVGALLARKVGESLSERGIPAHYPLIVAAGYVGMAVWHGGLSGSAPLTMTTPENAAKVLSGGAMERFQQGVPLTDTIFSPLNFVVTIGAIMIIVGLLALLAPRDALHQRPIEKCLDTEPGERERPVEIEDHEPTFPERMERWPVFAWLLALALIAATVRFAQVSGASQVGLNEINAGMLALGLILHGSPRSYGSAVEEAARGCAGIILQFPLYAGIMAMMSASGLVERIADALVGSGNSTGVPILTFVSAAIVNFFVPSGGGQWGIQGPIALQAGEAAGISPGRMIMSVAYGDQITNMLQPFWALPLLAITGVKARDIVGYTAIVMVAAGLWMALWLLLL